jgi:peroxiredoxin Q/BCP
LRRDTQEPFWRSTPRSSRHEVFGLERRNDAVTAPGLADDQLPEVVYGTNHGNPKDDTPGCTTQACSFRDAYGEFEERGAVVLGVSPDTESSHASFKAKHGLPFTLLADLDHKVAERYGVWVEKNMYGKKSMGIKRSTFVIDEDGKVGKAMLGVKPDGHADLVLSALP